MNKYNQSRSKESKFLVLLQFTLSILILSYVISIPAVAQQVPVSTAPAAAAAAERTTDGRLLIKIPIPAAVPTLSSSVTPAGGAAAATSPTVTCINPATDSILMTAPRVIVQKSGGLFRRDEEAGLYFNVTFGGVVTRDGREEAAPPYVRDNVSIVNVRDYQMGQITLPLEGNIIDYVRLNNGNATITKAQIKMFLLKKQGNTGFGFVVKNLAEFSKKLPLPPNPLSEGLRAVSDLTSSLLSDENNKANNIKERAATADITLNFVPGGTCDANSAITGIYGIVSKSTRNTAPGFVDLSASNMADYCFGAQATPVSALMVGKKPGGTGQCVPNQFVDNDYVMFVITKYTNLSSPNKPQIAVTVPTDVRMTRLAGQIDELVAVSNAGNPRTGVVPITDVLQTYSWYSSLTKDFQDRLAAAEARQQSGAGAGGSNIDDVLAEDYIRGIKSCAVAGVDLKKCPLPAPPERVLNK